MIDNSGSELIAMDPTVSTTVRSDWLEGQATCSVACRPNSDNWGLYCHLPQFGMVEGELVQHHHMARLTCQIKGSNVQIRRYLYIASAL